MLWEWPWKRHTRQKIQVWEFPGGSLGSGSGVVTAVAPVAAVVWVRSPTLELPHAKGEAKKRKPKRENLDTDIHKGRSSEDIGRKYLQARETGLRRSQQ